jgi:hypothetical protein
MPYNVAIGYCFPGDVSGRFADSLTQMIRADSVNGQYIHRTIALKSGPRVAEARSQIVDACFDDEQVEWLLMLDADMTFEPDLLERLMEVADERTAPIVGGLCFAGVHGGKVYPTLYKMWTEDDGHVAVEPVDEYPEDALVKVGATGAACLLVHKTVYAAMRRPSPIPGEQFDRRIHGFGTLPNGLPNPYPWFAEGLTTSKGIALGEDVAFCRRASALQIPIYVHTGVKLGHAKEWIIGPESHVDYVRERDRPSNVLTAAMRVLEQSTQFGPDELAAIRRYIQPRYSLLGPDARPKVEPFLLPEPIPVLA